MIREATEADIPRLLGFARRFHEAKQDRYGFDAASTEGFFRQVLAIGVVLIGSDGFLAGFALPEPSNSGHRVAHEAFWWSEGRDGLRLRKKFEQWAAAEGCCEVQFSHPEGERTVEKILTRAGYEPATRVWRKAI